MAKGIPFQGATHVLGPPAGVGEDDVYRLHVRKLDGNVVSCWELTDEEVARIVETRVVWLSLWGQSMPPARVEGLAEDVI